MLQIDVSNKINSSLLPKGFPLVVSICNLYILQCLGVFDGRYE